MKKQTSVGKILIIYLIVMACVVGIIIGAFTLLGDSRKPVSQGRGRMNEPAEEEAEKGRGRMADDESDGKLSETDDTVTTDREPRVAQNRVVRNQLVTPKGNGQDTVTVMIYMNGSNLETDSGYATMDISEILDANIGDKVNVVIQTMGTRRWQDYNISATHTQRYIVDGDQLVLVDDSQPQLDCTDPDTLQDFVIWSSYYYPADRYFLILWDHGGGSVSGYGYDQWQDYYASLTIDEIYSALSKAGVVFDFIGMDACIMSSIEICYAFYPFCDYTILSEDFESALGWSYTGWLEALSANTSISTQDLGKIIIDDMVADNSVGRYPNSSTLALIDERYIPAVMDAWMDFAFANEQDLLAVNYSREIERTGRSLPVMDENGELVFFDDDTRVSSELAEYYITDALALAVSVDSPYSKPLVAKLATAVAYYNCTADDSGMTGLAVTLPYEDYDFYQSLGEVFSGVGIQKRYIEWLGIFREHYEPTAYYNYDDFDDSWEGWDSLENVTN